jgi:hypothetical protein
MSKETQSKHEGQSPAAGHGNPGEHGEMEDYVGGYIQAHHGTIPVWLLVVYAILLVFAFYYMITYWGGLGPGLDY